MVRLRSEWNSCNRCGLRDTVRHGFPLAVVCAGGAGTADPGPADGLSRWTPCAVRRALARTVIGAGTPAAGAWRAAVAAAARRWGTGRPGLGRSGDRRRDRHHAGARWWGARVGRRARTGVRARRGRGPAAARTRA